MAMATRLPFFVGGSLFTNKLKVPQSLLCFLRRGVASKTNFVIYGTNLFKIGAFMLLIMLTISTTKLKSAKMSSILYGLQDYLPSQSHTKIN